MFAANAKLPIFRPYLGGSPKWGKVTFSECEAHLAVVERQRSQQLSELGFKSGDVIAVWYAFKFAILETCN